MSADSDPNDRKVILVASNEGLVKLAMKGYQAELIDAIADSSVYSPLGKILKYAKGEYVKHKKSEFQGKDRRELLTSVIDALDLPYIPYLVSPQDAVRRFKFGVGQTPVDGAVYVQHPIISDAYIDPAEFSRTVSKEKEAAFRQLASALGARELTLVNATIKTTRGLFGTTVSVGDAATEIGIKIAANSDGSSVRKVYSEYGAPRREPWIPPDLQPWVEIDPDLRTMARDRIDGHLLKATISLEFKEGLGVGGEVAAQLAARGFSAAGSYEKICHSIWYFDVEYYPIS